MQTRRVESGNWDSFLAVFNHSHAGWAGSLEVREAGQPARIEVDAGFFRRATLESRGGRDVLALTFGAEPEEQFAYIFREPTAMLSSERDDGSEASLIIEGGGGRQAVLLLAHDVEVEELAET